MRIAYVVPGTGGAFYCQNCLRDHNMVRALEGAGAEVTVAPLYLPLALDDSGWVKDSPIFFGAVNIYLQEKTALFRRTPRWVDRVFDSPALLRWASEKARSTSASGLEEMTLSMLRGEEGRQAKEVDRLLRWLEESVRPDVLHLSNALLLGLAGPVRRQLGADVVCTLQDENVWIDAMAPEYAMKTWELLRKQAEHVDAFVATSRSFAEKMARSMRLDPAKIHVVHPGLDFKGYAPAPSAPRPPVLGYLSRLSEDQGFGTLIDAFLLLKRMPGLEGLRLRATGGHTGVDEEFLLSRLRSVKEAGFGADVEILPEYGMDERIRFLQSLTALSVPVRSGDAFGLFMIEALGAGVPVVQPNAGAFPEVLEATGGGVLFEPNEPGALADAAALLLLDGEKARTLGLEGRKGVLERFDSTRAALRLLELYAACKR